MTNKASVKLKLPGPPKQARVDRDVCRMGARGGWLWALAEISWHQRKGQRLKQVNWGAVRNGEASSPGSVMQKGRDCLHLCPIISDSGPGKAGTHQTLMEKERGSKREGRGRQEAAAQMPEGEEVLRKRSRLWEGPTGGNSGACRVGADKEQGVTPRMD